MLSAGRSLLLALGFLSLQLTLISGGERCPIVSVFAHHGAAMAGMDMARPQGGGVQSDAPSTPGVQQSCDDDGERPSCDSMTVCVFAAVIAPIGVHNPQRRPAVRAPTLAMRTPSTEGAAPDLPPPRLQS